MRSQIISLLLTITLAVSVNAAAFDRREISPAAQVCIDSINSAGTQLAETSPSIDAFSSHDGYPGAYTIHTKKQLIESSLKKANNDCCPIDRPSDYEVAALLGVVKKLVPDVVKVLNTIVTKRLEFDNLAFATALLKKDIKQIKALTTSLTTCLLSKGSTIDKLVGNGIKTVLDIAFTAVEAL